MNYDKIGEFIVKLRKENGLTQKELGMKIGVTDKAISKWENGLGCPDVSLLEDLSNALNVSILEILKGRIIKEEELQNENLNELVLDTVNYSKSELNKKYKNIILNIITIIITVIIGFLIILNIYHIKYLNQYETFDFNETTFLTESTKKLPQIKSNIELIKNNINKISDNELVVNSIPLKLDEAYNSIINYPLISYEGKKKFYIKDFVLLDENYLSNVYFLSAYDILREIDSNFNKYYELFKSNAYDNFYKNDALRSKTNKFYKYTLIFNEPDEIKNPDYNINARIISAYNYIENLYFLTNSIIEAGVINE